MDVTLIQDVKGFGTRGTQVSVSDGYARSFLLPQKLAVEAVSAAGKQAVTENNRAQKARSVKKELVAQTLTHLPSSVTIYEKANETGGLFQAVNEKAIADALGDEKGQYDIVISQMIKETGEYTVDVNGQKLIVHVLNEEEK